MIISASYRTDIPALYGKWFQARLAAGYCLVRNPYGGAPFRADLAKAQGFVFWTRNAGPFLPVLEALTQPFMVQFTITGYPRSLESAVIATEAAIEQVHLLAKRYGPHCVVWRYDPIVITDTMDAAWHAAHFAELAARIQGATTEVVISFMTDYAKTKRNLASANIAWRRLPMEEISALAVRLSAIAQEHHMQLTICSDLSLPDFLPARCVDADRLSKIAGYDIAAKVKPNRPGCLCADNRDIGAYDTCVQGCHYCYAVSSAAKARNNLKMHDVSSEYL